MAAKRSTSDTPNLERCNSGGASKKPRFSDTPSMACSTSQDLDVSVLRFQNKKLGDRLIARQKLEADLRQRIEAAEKKQTSAEAIVYVINRYWNQLNEDVRILLQRFDAETADETESSLESDVTTSFLAQLSNWDSEEMSEQLQQRVDASTRAITKVVQAFDRIAQRNAKITVALTEVGSLDEAVKQANVELTIENKNLSLSNTKLHEKVRRLNLELSEFKDKAEALEASSDELKNRMDELEFELNRMRNRELRLEHNLQEAKEKIRSLESGVAICNASGSGNSSTAASASRDTSQKHEELTKELEEMKELSANRLTELEQLHATHKETLKTVDKLKMDLQCIPTEVVTETAEYKCLQSHFSVLYNECMQLKTQLEETRVQLQSSKNNHLRQIEHMESEELSMQKRLRTEVIQLEDSLAQVRREHEMLRLEFEQVMAANEQTVPINREMRNLITSLQNHNGQLKAEIGRWKKKLKEKEGANASLNDSGKGDTAAGSSGDEAGIKKEAGETGDANEGKLVSDLQKQLKELRSKHESLKSMYEVSQRQLKEYKKTTKAPAEKGSTSGGSSSSASTTSLGGTSTNSVASLFCASTAVAASESSNSSVTSAGPTESPATPAVAAAGVVAAAAVASGGGSGSGSTGQTGTGTSSNLSSSSQAQRESAASATSVVRNVEITRLRDKVRQLERQISAMKEQYNQQEEALCSEMEVTGSAFENMQEMNIRLVQQLREKDEANFKLMAEKIKSSQIQKLLKEEKESLTEQVIALNAQVEAQNQVVRKLEEKERLLQNNLATIEKETQLKQQALESHKRKALEAAQTAADLKLHLDKYLSQLKEAQSTVAEKTSALQEQAYKTTRLQEDLNAFKRKYERAKKFELATTADEVLQEEIREYKDQLTCPSCKARRKDAVLTRCFHVFCYECLKTRYESRQRKCPKCTQNFGASDFHKLYLA